MSNNVTVETIFGTLTEEQVRLLTDALKEVDVHLTRVDAEKQAIKDIIGNVFDEIKVPKKILNRLAKTHHKKNFAEESTENSEFETLYSVVAEKLVQQ